MISEFGYVRGNATKEELYFEVSMLNSTLGFDYRIYRHIFFFACILCVDMFVSYDSSLSFILAVCERKHKECR